MHGKSFNKYYLFLFILCVSTGLIRGIFPIPKIVYPITIIHWIGSFLCFYKILGSKFEISDKPIFSLIKYSLLYISIALILSPLYKNNMGIPLELTSTILELFLVYLLLPLAFTKSNLRSYLSNFNKSLFNLNPRTLIFCTISILLSFKSLINFSYGTSSLSSMYANTPLWIAIIKITVDKFVILFLIENFFINSKKIPVTKMKDE